ncbi:MAG: type III pantothenate kinase [Gammaproteobacteria bacterium]
MTLLVDVGNTRIRWAILDDGALCGGAGVSHVGMDLGPLLEQRWEALARPERILVSNVAGAEWAAALETWSRAHWDLAPEYVVPCRKAFGVINAYHVPQRLGADRWAALVALRQRMKANAFVVDCGTAITVDVLSAEGEHLGGLIIPGLAMMRRALAQQTAGVPDEPDGQVSLLARDTRDAVTGGTLYAVVAALDRVVGDIAEVLTPEPTPVITGGDAERVLPLLRRRYIHAPDLVLEGLAVMAACDS